MHIVGAILCLFMAAVLATVAIDDWNASPVWESGLTLFVTFVMLASGARVYLTGARRKREIDGPRTRIVLTDLPQPPRRSHRSKTPDD